MIETKKKSEGSSILTLFSERGTKQIARKTAALGLSALMAVNTVLIAAPASAEAATIDLKNGLVGYYPFEGTLDNSVTTGSATLHGGAGDTWAAAATGTAAYAQGKNGKAYSFTGDVNGSRGEGLQLDVNTGADFTISLWVNTAEKIDFQPIVFTNADGDNYLAAGTYYNNYASGALILSDGWANATWLDKNAPGSASTLKDLVIGQWTYLTITVSSDGTATLYYDAEVLAQKEIAGWKTNMLTNTPIFLGVNWWNESFKGLMDEVTVYNRVLSAEEVSALYANNGVPSDELTSIVTPTHVSVHDPSIIKDEKTGMYYVFGTHMAWAKSNDLIHWETFTNNINKDYATLFADGAKWSSHGSSSYDVSGNLWAPDVIWNEEMGKWCMYMSVNGDNWYTSVALLTADSLDGDWEYKGTVVYSGFTNSSEAAETDFATVTGSNTVPDRYLENRNGNHTYGMNAIDPCVLYDENGDLWMSYGSWFGGIYMLKLDKGTGLRDYTYKYETAANESDEYQGIKIAGGQHSSGEASYIQKIGNYYYLFMSYGELIATGGYNMRVFRSDNITGPYVDYSGDSARYTAAVANVNGTVGNRLMSGYQWSYMKTGYVAQGHNSAFVDNDGKAYVVYHTRFNDGTEGHEVRVHQLFVNEDGWLVTAPFEYTGETLTSSVTAADVAGDYEVLFHKLNIDFKNLEVVEGENITFSADGKITGDRTGTWAFSSKGAPYVTMTIGSVTYKGVFVQQQMEDSTDTTWCFTVLGSDEISVWGYKYVGDGEELATKAAENLSMPQGTFTNITLPDKGINGSKITWKSSNEAVLTSDGTITIPSTDTVVTLTGTFTVQGVSVTKAFPITVYSPQSDTENKVLAKYFTGEEVSLAGVGKGTYQYANPFYEGTTVGLQMYNGVSIKFDLKAAGSDRSQWRDIIGFNAGSEGGLFFQDTAYLGYNGTGGIFDANLQNGSFNPAWLMGTDFLGDSASVEIQILPTGFAVYVNGKLAYDQDDVEPYVSGKTDYTVPGQIAVDSFGSVLDYLQNTATDMNFGWGSYWGPGYDGTISNVVISALPVEVVDTTGYLFYENFTRLAGKTGAATGWTSGNSQTALSIKLAADDNRYYLDYAAVGSDSGNRGAYMLFDEEVRISGEYTIELDTALTAGVLTQRSQSGFAILGTDAANYTGDAEVSSGYIFKLRNEPPQGTAANQTDKSLQDQWYINDSKTPITIPVGTWVHIKADVNTDDGTAAVTITNRATGAVLYEGDVDINGSGTLGGLWLLRGRGVGTASIDNIAVHIHDWDTGTITKQPGCEEEGERTFTCSVCGDIHTEAIAALGHTASEAVEIENEVDSTCLVDGSYDEVTYCAVCGEELSRQTVTIPAPGSHDIAFKEVEGVAATETEDGYYYYVEYCTRCDEELSREKITIPSLNHNWDEGTITTEPTCTEAGWKTHYCTDEGCNEVWKELIEALGHDWEEVTVTPATCSHYGEASYKCSRCDETKTEILPILPHQEGEEEIENEEPATCTEGGSYDLVVRCEVGGEIIRSTTIFTDPLGHQKAEAVKENEVPATCETAGSYEEVIYCSRCDEELSRETKIVPALGHEWDEGTITAATCTEDGKIVYHCTRSGCEETKEEVIPATGHSYGKPVFTWNSDDSATAAFTCEVCDDVQTVDATVTMTTTESGMIIYTASVEMDGETYTSKKQIIPLETDGDSDMRVVVADGFEEIPDTLVKNDIKSEEDIEKILKDELEEKGYVEQGYVEENFVLYDIVLQITTDQGESWETVTAETFPEEGIMITIPYPEGTNGTDYDFVVTHMLTVAMNGYQPGEVEILDVTKTDAGLQFTVTSLSPIAVSWTALEPEEPTTEDPKEPTTEDPAVTPEEPTTEDPAVTPEEPTTEDPATEDPKTQDPAVPASPVADGTDTPDDSEKNSNNSTSSPKTADSDRFVWTLLCGAFGGGLAGIAAKNRRKKNNAR